MGNVPVKQLKQKDIPELRTKLLEEQKEICPICKRKIKDPCLDHSHKKRIKGTGLVRGVLCRTCNIFLAKSENNCIRFGIPLNELPTVLRNMADYLEKEPFPFVHPLEAVKEPKLRKSSYNKLVKKLKKQNRKIPPYPKSGKLTKELALLFKKYNIEPTFYQQNPK